MLFTELQNLSSAGSWLSCAEPKHVEFLSHKLNTEPQVKYAFSHEIN